MTLTRGNKLPVLLSATALLVAVAGAGGPALARAFDAQNAHKVDGKHAVGAGVSKSARSGKLVATASNGYLPNNILKKSLDANKVDGIDSRQLQIPPQVPAGMTIRGRWGFDGDSDGTGDWGAVVSFQAPIPGIVATEFVFTAATAHCTGTEFAPTAAPGYLCFYLESGLGTGLDFANPSADVTPYGGRIFFSANAGGDVFAIGSWAATAPLTVARTVARSVAPKH